MLEKSKIIAVSGDAKRPESANLVPLVDDTGSIVALVQQNLLKDVLEAEDGREDA